MSSPRQFAYASNPRGVQNPGASKELNEGVELCAKLDKVVQAQELLNLRPAPARGNVIARAVLFIIRLAIVLVAVGFLTLVGLEVLRQTHGVDVARATQNLAIASRLPPPIGERLEHSLIYALRQSQLYLQPQVQTLLALVQQWRR